MRVVTPHPHVPRPRTWLATTIVLGAFCSACGGGGGGNGTSSQEPVLPPLEALPAGTISVLAGDATATGSTNGKGTAARFNSPHGLAVDGYGTVYVADEYNYVIRKITVDGTVSTLAGTAGVNGNVDGLGAAARFTLPLALALDRQGMLYVADGLAIRKVTPEGAVTTVTAIDLPPNADGRSLTQFISTGIARDADGTLYVTNSIDTRRISPAGQTTLLEGPAPLSDLTNPKLLVPRGIAGNGSGNVYVADLTKTIGNAAPAATKLTSVAGTAGQTGNADGAGAAARFAKVVALALDKPGNVFAADAGNNLIRKITPGGTVTTVAGTAGSTALKTGTAAAPGSLAELAGIAVDSAGNVYASSGNAIVKIGPK